MLRSLLLAAAGPSGEHLLKAVVASSSRLLPASSLAAAHTQQQQQQQQPYATGADSSTSPSRSSQEAADDDSNWTDIDQHPSTLGFPHQQETQALQPPLQQLSHLQEVPSRLPGPIQPTHILLQAVRQWQDEPPSSFELYTAVNKEYAGVFPSRTQFKKHLLHLVKKKWVAAKPPAAATAAAAAAAAAAPSKGKKKAKASNKGPFVYVATRVGMAVDVCEPGSPLEVAARQRADAWTAKKLPGYSQLLQAGRIPVGPDNVQLLGAEAGMAQFLQQQRAEHERQEVRQQRKANRKERRRQLFGEQQQQQQQRAQRQ